MRQSPQSAVVVAVAASLRDEGFEHAGRTWWRRGVETIQVVDLQSTASGRQMFLSAGVYFRLLGPALTPAARECHIRVAAEEIASRPLPFRRALDFGDAGVDLDHRVRTVVHVLERRVLPWLEGYSTEARARAALRRGVVTAWATPPALRWLGLEGRSAAGA